ncbi:hypothetical protein SELMODRAFT_431706 [Selaginella moellendorffii]|uniref:Uncharacterized protein n=1 Tax=Selaginella moellendorffii TaxID=88036 RepID=D8TDI3_SELML|nr:hypothetical protein SELMODRAFT_431706 [Selaginella moellendorffii]
MPSAAAPMPCHAQHRHCPGPPLPSTATAKCPGRAGISAPANRCPRQVPMPRHSAWGRQRHLGAGQFTGELALPQKRKQLQKEKDVGSKRKHEEDEIQDDNQVDL